MLAEAATLFLALLGPSAPALPLEPYFLRQVVYHAASRSTSNWRWQSALHLDLPPERVIQFATRTHPKRLPRCIRLNNYWCIKKAGWVGEVASDNEGHVAFSSSLEGAIVAARLLRRYYVDYKRKSAMAIVSRWAPAQCGLVARPRGGRVSRGLAKRGIHRTLRARFLARHGRGGVAKRTKSRKYRQARARLRRSRVRSRPAPLMRAPSISPGQGEIALPAMRLASLASRPAPKIRRERAVPRIGCTSEALRIRSYASKISTGIAENNKADLKLFASDGTPTANLAAAMYQMAAVEIGPYKVNKALISTAIKALAAMPPRKAAK